MSKKELNISICVPAFNEEDNIESAIIDLHSALSTAVTKFEIIIVDDASTDATPSVASELSKKYSQIRVISHRYNKGMGSCFKDALSKATGNYFTWFPADHENSAEEIIACLSYLKNDSIVTCNHCGFDNRTKFRQIISNAYTWLLNKRFKIDLKYYNGLTIAPKDILQSFVLESNGFAFSAEIIINLLKHGYKMVEVSLPLRGRSSGRSKVFNLISILRTFHDINRLCGNKKL